MRLDAKLSRPSYLSSLTVHLFVVRVVQSALVPSRKLGAMLCDQNRLPRLVGRRELEGHS